MSIKAASLLDKRPGEVERPKPLPIGTWNGVIKKTEFGETKNKDTSLKLTIGGLSAGEDVNHAELEGLNLSSKSATTTFVLRPDTLFRLSEFIATMPIEDVEQKSLNESIAELVNLGVTFEMKHRASEDGTQVYEQLDKLRGQEG
jgi:hypothetical protein